MNCTMCGNAPYSRGLCRKHYDSERHSGRLTIKPTSRGMSLIEKLKFYSAPDAKSGCLIWTGGRFSRGYGSCVIDRKAHYAHRIAYEVANGNIPDGLLVLHKCDNPPCINVNHLFLGTSNDNMQDMLSKGRGKFLAGSAHGLAKLTQQQIDSIRADRRPQRHIARTFGIAQSHVGRIKRGESWTR